MESIPSDETVEIDRQRFITLAFERVWPKYVVTWSVRQRAGDGDFPIATGKADSLPPTEGPITILWDRLREEALDQAAKVSGPAKVAPEEKKGLLARLLGR